jgi:hypothetical protein
MAVLAVSSFRHSGLETSEPRRQGNWMIRWFGRLPCDILPWQVHLPFTTCIVICSLFFGGSLLFMGLMWLILKIVYFNL